MADDTKPGATQGNDDQTDNTDDTTNQDDDLDKVQGLGDQGKEAIRKEREARAAAEKSRKETEKQLRETAKRLKDFEDKDKSEAEKLAGERDTWQKSATDYRDKYRKAAAAEVIRSEAVKAGADPRRVDRIVRLVRPDLAFDKDGDDPTNVETLIRDLKKSDADLFAPVNPGKGDGGAGGGGKPKPGGATAVLREYLRGSG